MFVIMETAALRNYPLRSQIISFAWIFFLNNIRKCILYVVTYSKAFYSNIVIRGGMLLIKLSILHYQNGQYKAVHQPRLHTFDFQKQS